MPRINTSGDSAQCTWATVVLLLLGSGLCCVGVVVPWVVVGTFKFSVLGVFGKTFIQKDRILSVSSVPPISFRVPNASKSPYVSDVHHT